MFANMPIPGLIAFKLLTMQMKLRNNGISTSSTFSRRILRIFVESAALYSLNHLLYAVLYEGKSNLEATSSFLVSISSVSRLFGWPSMIHPSTGSQHSQHHM